MAMKSRTWTNIGITFIISGVIFIILGIVFLVAGVRAINFVTIGAGAVQILSGLSIIDMEKRMSR